MSKKDKKMIVFSKSMSLKKERAKLIEKNLKGKANIVLLLTKGEDAPIEFSSKHSYRVIGDSKENTPFIQYLGNAMESLILEKDSVDAMVLGQILSMLENPRTLIEKMYHALKEEGLLLAAFPNKKNVSSGNYKSLFDIRKWKYIFEVNSFVIEKIISESDAGLGKVSTKMQYLLSLPHFVEGKQFYILVRKLKEGCRRNPDFLHNKA